MEKRRMSKGFKGNGVRVWRFKPRLSRKVARRVYPGLKDNARANWRLVRDEWRDKRLRFLCSPERSEARTQPKHLPN